MLYFAVLVVNTLLALQVEGIPAGRTVSRSLDEGNVNLVEVRIRNVLYGRCSFFYDGESLELLYEEEDGNLRARAQNPTVLDPISKAQECRDAAASPPETQATFRSAVNDEVDESPIDTQKRLIALQRNMRSNQQFVSELRPRFFGWGHGDDNDNDFLIKFGYNPFENVKDNYDISLPTQEYNKFGLAFPLRLLSHFG